MKCQAWILLSIGFLLFGQVWSSPTAAKTDEEYQDEEPEDGTINEEDEEVVGPSPRILSKNDTFNVDIGKTLVLPCKIENAENAVVMWWIQNPGNTLLWSDKIPMAANKHKNFQLGDDHSLTINEITAEDGNTYKCDAVHGKETESVTYQVNVAVASKVIRIVPEGPKKVVEKGTPLTLMCEASGFPKPEIHWIKTNKHSTEEKIEGAKIAIDSVNRKHSGTYTCVATNIYNQKTISDSKQIEIHVTYQPEVDVEKELVNAGEGYETELVCIVHSDPKAKVTWLKDDQQITFDHHISTESKGSKHILRISATKKSDFGAYRCNATNLKGMNSKIISLSGKPSRPKFESVEEIPDSKTVSLSWSVDSYADIKEYELRFKLQDGDEWKTGTPIVTPPESGNKYIVRHSLEGLEPGVYQVQLKAKNDYGWSELAEPRIFTKDDQNSELTQQGHLESSKTQESAASEIRISFAFVIALLVARFYC